jgi:hypothetical protein
MTTTMRTTKTPAERALRLAAAKIGSKARPQGGHLIRLAGATGCRVEASVGSTTFDTGCWRFEKGKHVIVLGAGFEKHLRPGCRRKAVAFGEAILRHEAWHGRVTARDLQAVAAQCKTRAIPFLLVNLFEDARIEHLARQAEGEFFQWPRFHNAEPVTCPLTSFYAAKHWESTASGWKCKDRQANRDKVQEFYDRAIACADTFAIVDLAQEWVEYWAQHGYPMDQQKLDANNPHASDEIGSESDGSRSTNTTHGVTSVGKTGRDDVRTDAPKLVGWDRFRDYTGNFAIDGKLADRVANRMRDVIARTASPRTARVSTSGSRLHLPGVAVGSEQAFRSYGKTGGKPSLVVVIDFSGSMSRDWAQHGRYFTAAIMRLARSGVLNVAIYATGGNKYAPLPTTLSDAMVNQLGPHLMGENIRATLDTIAPAMQQADATVVYTDAELMDGSVDAQAWRRRGVDLVGAVVIPAGREPQLADKQRSEMRRHFGTSITAFTGDQLATKLAQHLAQRWQGR